jgi:TldD protein
LNDSLTRARQVLLAPAALDDGQLGGLLKQLTGGDIDFGELYFQALRSESWALEDGIVKEGAFNADRGVGVRALAGEKTGFAYADDITTGALADTVRAARSIARQGASGSQPLLRAIQAPARYAGIDPLGSLTEVEKIAVLESIDTEARRADPRVTQVNARLGMVHDIQLVVATDGTLAADERPLVRVDVSVIVEQGGRRERGSAGAGGRTALTALLANDLPAGLAREAVRIALVALDAAVAPAGPMPVVLGPGWPGVLLHEAVGHGLEGDFNRKGSSAFSGRVGERVASPLCTVVDDGTLADRRGSLSVDDEGTPTRRNVLIENGILKGYMQDKLNARLMNTVSTGNGRRQSYAHLPLPRMTNTFMLAGSHSPAEIIASVERGLYAVNFGGGQVDITSGKFVFSTTEAYLIEGGKITRPVKGATLIGSGPDVMQRISMVGDDLALDAGVGVCGKEGQSLPVGVGQPTLRVDQLTVGGTG